MAVNDTTALDAARFLFQNDQDRDAARIIMMDGDEEERLEVAHFLYKNDQDRDAARIIMMSEEQE